MRIVILDGMERENSIEGVLKGIIKGETKHSYFKLKDKNILPCKSCGVCSYKEVGKCIFKDDSHEILRALANCDIMVMVTPIRFGGYNSQLKKISDKIALLATPLFTVIDGHLLHPTRYGKKAIVAIGMIEGDSKAQEESLKTLVANNGLNLQYSHKTLIFKASEDQEKIKNDIEEAIKGGR